MFLSGEEIYNNFQQASGGAKLGQSAALVNDLAKSYNEQADEIKKLVAATEAVWKGEASGTAQRGVGPLAVEHALAAPALGTAQDLANRQVGSFDDAKNAVIPVPPAPEKVDPLAAFMNPGALVTYGEQLGAHKEAAQHNVDVMRGYENASVYNMGMPESYGQITSDQSEIRVASPTPIGPGDGDDSGSDRPGSGPAKPTQSTGDGQPRTGGGSYTGSTGGPVTGPSPADPGGGSGVGGGAPVVVPPVEHGTTPGGYVPPSPPGVGPGVPGGGLPQGGQGTGFGGGGLPVVGIGPVGIPDGGEGSGGRGGPGGSGVGGPRAGGPGVGGRPGAGLVGEPMVGQPSGAQSGSVTARGGSSGMPVGAGAGKGRGGEDEEHERASFLQEPDPESAFGTNEITAPPVIGEQP